MNELETVNHQRRMRALEIVATMESVQELIAADPDMWLGGLPASLAGAFQNLDYVKRDILASFNLVLTPPAEEPEPTLEGDGE